MVNTCRAALLALLSLLLVTACTRHNRAAVSLYEAGDYAGAARAADDGLGRHPRDEGLWQMRIRAALALGDGEGVATAYRAYRETRSSDDRALLRDLVVATLRQALASPAAKIRIAAIESVAEAELQVLAEQVAERMGDTDDRVAAAAAVAVLRGFPQAPQVAADMLRSDDAEARRIAVEGIGKKVGALALVDLRRAAEDRDARVRRAALRWIGQLKDSESVEVVSERLRKDPDESVRGAAALALARIGQGDLLAYAQQALGDPAATVKLGAIELAIAARRPELLAALVEDADPMIAAEASFSAGRGELAAKAVERASASTTWTVRAGAVNIAARALGKAAAIPLAKK
ncbi:MAG: HEAT repeat domain-containing protein, partial [Deltaproteobacteria bacterium]|nr:HEAT repeat domain-containing protein [Deltaproteobacteria bacterium]